MKVIGTAGHIDHGKSTLVHALTGIDPDRFAEEKVRGMTIDLGFAWLPLPSGAEVSIVDVPGHERFVKNMLAGAGGVDVALLVVAADESVMPQTREHVDILDLLQVRYGVVALTKTDLVDGDLIELAKEEVQDLLAGTALEGSPIVPVSAVVGTGLDTLVNELERAVEGGERSNGALPPYLPVDRVFTVSGFGTVVTGTLHGSTLRTGDEVEIAPRGRRGRIRSLQTHRKQAQIAHPGTRVAANIAGLSIHDVERGDVLALPGSVRAVRRVDALLRVLPSAPFPLSHGMEATMHVGAAERTATVAVLAGDEIMPGQTGWVQLRLSEPVAAVPGQRFILRLPSPARTFAGGELLDLAPRHRRTDAMAVQRLSDLASGDPERAILAALAGGRPRTLDRIAEAVGRDRPQVERIVSALAASGRIVDLGSENVSVQGWIDIEDRAKAALSDFHSLYPLRAGMPAQELRSRLRLRATLWPSVLVRLEHRGIVVRDGPSVALPGHRGGTSSRQAEVGRVIEALEREPLSPPSGSELLEAAQTDTQLLEAMAAEGKIRRITDGLYFAPDAYSSMMSRTLELIERDGQVTVASLRDELKTSRKYVLSFLEHLDAQRITRRVGDARVRGSRAPTGV